MNDQPVGIVGGMGASLDGPELGGGAQPQAHLEIGVVENHIGYRITPPGKEPVILMFTVAEMYSIMAAQQNAIMHIMQNAPRS